MRPITAQPGHLEDETEDAMQSGQFVYADCYTIIPKAGSPLRYTTAQHNVSVVPIGEVSRQTYNTDVIITGLRVRTNLGLEVDEQNVELSYPRTIIYQAALTWYQALLQGRLDGARITRDRYIAQRWGRTPQETDWLGGFPMFRGLMSTVDKAGRQSATVKVKSDLVLLNINMPKDLFEPNCRNTWGDVACGVDQSEWAVQVVIAGSPTRSVLPWSAVDAHYNQGKIHIENNDDVTRVRTISRVSAGLIHLSYPLDFDPAVGQQFTAYPGCPRTIDPTYGCPKYHDNWQEKIRAFPFIPVAETAA